MYRIFLPYQWLGPVLSLIKAVDEKLVAPICGSAFRSLLGWALEAFGINQLLPNVPTTSTTIPVWYELPGHRDAIGQLFRSDFADGWVTAVTFLGPWYVTLVTIRYVEDLLKWSFWLEICAFASGMVLLKLDPYSHQIQSYSGIAETAFFFGMLRVIMQTTEYWHRCNAQYGERILRECYPNI
ncbi:hypothetical protein JX266_002583 [Neoarthrinium moseri]|nr:hypothetical protein JX266_002583 [Neoarthrinium moseri]